MQRRSRTILMAIPLALLIVLGFVFFRSLHNPSDPFRTVLIDKPVPSFNLPAIAPPNPAKIAPGIQFIPPPGIASDDLPGAVSLVNIFGSWCVACRIEHPLLMELSKANSVPIIGIDWKDEPGDGAAWLARFGNPYSRVGDDAKGRTAIDFGVTGAPETFIIDHKGHIRYKHVGPITEQEWINVLSPMINELNREAGNNID